MKNIEIEKKYLIRACDLPANYKKYKSHKISQGFLSIAPCIRVRKQDNNYYFTLKTIPPKEYNKYDDLVRTEVEIEIPKKVYNDLISKCNGNIIVKRRYMIPYRRHTIELDIFENELKGLVYAEVEFKSVKDANNFVPPVWFHKDVTNIDKYKNTMLSVCKNLRSILP